MRPRSRHRHPRLLAGMLAGALVALVPSARAVVQVDDFEDGCTSLCFPLPPGLERNGFLIDNDLRILSFGFYDGTFDTSSGPAPVTEGTKVTAFPSGDEVMWNGSAHLASFAGPRFRFLGAEFAGWDISPEYAAALGHAGHVPSTTIVVQGYVGGASGTLVDSASYSLTTDAFIHASGFATPIDTLVIRSDPASVPYHSWLMDDLTWEFVPEPGSLALLVIGLAGARLARRRTGAAH